MKKRILLLLLLPLVCGTTYAQKVAFDWNVKFDFLFNNCEFDNSKGLVQPSGTLNAARLAPYGGLLIGKGTNVLHRVMAGVDLAHNFGDGDAFRNIYGEPIFFYRMDASLGNGALFKAVAGIFSQDWRKNRESGPFFDDMRMFLDPNMEGLLFTYDGNRFSVDLGMDWMGRFGDTAHPTRRERFEIFSSGEWRFSEPVSFRWNGSFYHFASCPAFEGVVDNDLVELSLDAHPRTWFDSFSIRLGGLVSYQYDRAFEDAPVFPGGLYSRQTLEKFHVGICNEFYWGGDLMPFYDHENGGIRYGDDLYRGMKCFHTRIDGASVCDNLSVYYAPRIADILTLKVLFRFQMGTPYEAVPFFRGWQQIISLGVNLDCLRPRPSNRSRNMFFRYEML